VSRFWRGFFVCMALHGLVEDWYGLEGYVQLCRNQWVTMSWMWWLIPLVLLLGYHALDLLVEFASKQVRNEQDRRKHMSIPMPAYRRKI
jgi:hypothetical protein